MAVQRRRNTASSSESVGSEVANNGGGSVQNTSIQTAQSAQKPPSRDWTRHWVALVYIGAFLAIVALTLIFMLWRCYTVTDIKDVLLAESGVLSGPLGFIIGFYFKEELEKKDNV